MYIGYLKKILPSPGDQGFDNYQILLYI